MATEKITRTVTSLDDAGFHDITETVEVPEPKKWSFDEAGFYEIQ